MKFTILIITMAAALLCGCDTVAPAQKLETTRTFEQPYDKVWVAIVQATSKDDYPLKIVQKDSGVIETENFTPSSLAGCASPPSGLFLPCWGETRARMSIFASAIGTNTTVKVVGHFEGFEYNVTKQWYVWDSNGQFENAFLNDVSSFIH